VLFLLPPPSARRLTDPNGPGTRFRPIPCVLDLQAFVCSTGAPPPESVRILVYTSFIFRPDDPHLHPDPPADCGASTHTPPLGTTGRCFEGPFFFVSMPMYFLPLLFRSSHYVSFTSLVVAPSQIYSFLPKSLLPHAFCPLSASLVMARPSKSGTCPCRGTAPTPMQIS